MTIYILHNDASESATLLDDKSLGKMISDIAQVLCNVHYYAHVETSVKDIPFEQNYGAYMGWTNFAGKCLANYNTLLAYAKACCFEWLDRFAMKDEIFWMDKYKHKHHDVIEWASENKPGLPKKTASFGGYNAIGQYKITEVESVIPDPFPLVMSDKYIVRVKGDPYKHPQHLDCHVEIKGEMQCCDVIESYRAYYRAKLKLKQKKYVGCLGLYCKEICNCKVYKFTRREIPSFLGDL